MTRAEEFKIYTWLMENKKIAETTTSAKLKKIMENATGIKLASAYQVNALRVDAGIVARGYQGASKSVHTLVCDLEARVNVLEGLVSQLKVVL